jgi:hypothetical protein
MEYIPQNPILCKLGTDAGLLNYIEHETPREYFMSAFATEEDVFAFAEMIIAKCVDIMKQTQQSDVAYNAMIVGLIAEINHYFGLDETKRKQFRESFEKAFENGADLSGKETP